MYEGFCFLIDEYIKSEHVIIPLSLLVSFGMEIQFVAISIIDEIDGKQALFLLLSLFFFLSLSLSFFPIRTWVRT